MSSRAIAVLFGLVITAVVLTILPRSAAAADCGTGCSEACSAAHSSDTEQDAWAACVEACLQDCLVSDPPDVPDVPPPAPAEEKSRGPGGDLMIDAQGPALPGTHWRFVEVRGAPVAEGVEATLDFAERNVAGSSGCNRFAGTYTSADGAVAFSELISTKMMCPDDRMSVELAVQTALREARFATVEDGRLILLQIQGGASVAILAPRSPAP